VRRLLSGAGVSDGSVHGLSLVFEELATNGVRHGSPPVQVTVSVADQGWLVVVSDSATDCVPTPAQGRDPGRGGLGLTIVTRLSRACGWYVDDARKHVWAWLDAGEPTFAPTDVRAPRPNPTAAPTPECSPG
jgi:two-component sensor histidine kinase